MFHQRILRFQKSILSFIWRHFLNFGDFPSLFLFYIKSIFCWLWLFISFPYCFTILGSDENYFYKEGFNRLSSTWIDKWINTRHETANIESHEKIYIHSYMQMLTNLYKSHTHTKHIYVYFWSTFPNNPSQIRRKSCQKLSKVISEGIWSKLSTFLSPHQSR